MVTIVILGVVAVMIALMIGFATGKDRYAQMSEEEFEAEAKRASALGAAVMGLQKVLEPNRVEYILQRDKRVEGEQAPSGDPPSAGHSSADVAGSSTALRSERAK